MFNIFVKKLNKMSEKEFTYELNLLRPKLFEVAFKFFKSIDDAEDLIQETFLKALKYRDKYRSETNFAGWVYTIMRNTYFNISKRKKLFVSGDDENNEFRYLSYSPSNGMLQDNMVNEKYILKQINSLSDNIKIPFLKYIDGFKYEEIADEMNLPLGTIKSRIFYARKELMKKLKELNP